MNKIGGKVALAIVSIILGFMITNQLKTIANKGDSTEKKNVAQITIEVEQLKKQKEDMEKQLDDLQEQIKVYETNAANENSVANAIFKELERTRILMGSVDVVGEGIIYTISPSDDIFSAADILPVISYGELVSIVNELNFADAEAISINDIRITARTGIRAAGNAILINEERISPTQEVVIKAIGNKEKLMAALNFPTVVDYFTGFDVKIEPVDSVEILKYNMNFEFIYAIPKNDD